MKVILSRFYCTEQHIINYIRMFKPSYDIQKAYIKHTSTLDTFEARKINPFDLNLYFTTFHISQSENHVLSHFSFVPNNTTLISQAVVPAWLNSIDLGAIWKALQFHSQTLYTRFDIYFCISHAVIPSKSVFIVHILESIVNNRNRSSTMSCIVLGKVVRHYHLHVYLQNTVKKDFKLPKSKKKRQNKLICVTASIFIHIFQKNRVSHSHDTIRTLNDKETYVFHLRR